MEPKDEPLDSFNSFPAGNEINNMTDSTLWEPKEEPIDDFLLMPAENETVTLSDAIMKEEVKEEPLDLVDSFPFVNEISKQYSMDENDSKKEEIIDDEEFLGSVDQSGNYVTPPLFSIEPKTKVIENRESNGLELFDDAKGGETAMDSYIRRRGRQSRTEELASSYGLPVSAHEIVEMPIYDLQKLLKSASLTETQREIIRKIRRRGKNTKSARRYRDRLKNEEINEDGNVGCEFVVNYSMTSSPSLLGFVLPPDSAKEPLIPLHSSRGNEIDIMTDSTLMEPKEEPLEDFPLMPAENEIDNMCDSTQLEWKETPDSLQYMIDDKECKKEENIDDEEVLNLPPPSSPVKDEPIVDEYIQDLVRLGQIPAWDAVLDQSARYGISPTIPVEPKEEDVKHEIQFVAEKKASSNNEASLTQSSGLRCLECEYCTRSVKEWIQHLKEAHYTNPVLSGLALRCDCGHESLTGTHLCASANLMVIRRTDGPIRRVVNEQVLNPPCVLCTTCPTTICAYIDHLDRVHGSSLKENNIYLKCSCGVGMQTVTPESGLKHTGNCDPYRFTLQELKVGAQFAPQCILCEKYPDTVYNYAWHLRQNHASDLEKNEIYLICSCGFEIYSVNSFHSKNCKGRNFSLHKIADKSTPRCHLCKYYPTNIYDYADHLRFRHRSTLKANFICLLCSCGFQVRDCARDPVHIRKCDGLQFTRLRVIERKIIFKENNIHSTPQCILCEKYPTTTFDYAYHIFKQHNSTMIANGIYLLCSCCVNIRSIDRYVKHNNKCDGRKFALHELDKE